MAVISVCTLGTSNNAVINSLFNGYFYVWHILVVKRVKCSFLAFQGIIGKSIVENRQLMYSMSFDGIITLVFVAVILFWVNGFKFYKRHYYSQLNRTFLTRYHSIVYGLLFFNTPPPAPSSNSVRSVFNFIKSS